MGTNYYLHKDNAKCPHCGHTDDSGTLHIGKSSAGWAFALHVTPEIPDLDSWEFLFSDPNATINDEYGREVTPAEMMDVITKRVGVTKRALLHGISNYERSSGHESYDLVTGTFS